MEAQLRWIPDACDLRLVIALAVGLIAAPAAAQMPNAPPWPLSPSTGWAPTWPERLQGPYLGKGRPGTTPRMFAEGIVALGNHEHHLTVSPDGREMLWVIADRYRTRHAIVGVVERNGAWEAPEVAAFSGRYNDFAPSFVPDGSALLFSSNRPLPGTSEPTEDANLWEVAHSATGWGEPHPLPAPVNDNTAEYNPSMTRDGLLVFQDQDSGAPDIYTTRQVNGVWQPPRKIEGTVNTAGAEITPFVSADGSTLVFASDRAGGEGDMDIYVSHRLGGDTWSDAENLGPRINTPWPEAIPTLSPDGKVLFFTSFEGYAPSDFWSRPYDQLVRMLRSAKNGDGTLYWVTAEPPRGDSAWSSMTGLVPSVHPVGFRTLKLDDPARPGIAASGDVHRTVDAWLWYPTATTGAQVLLSRYLDLAAEEFAHAAGNAPEALASLLRNKLVAHGVREADLTQRLATPMLAREGGSVAGTALPVIVLGQGLFYESPLAQVVLCEYLASQGFVVATAPLLGTKKADMELSVADLVTEADDLDLVRGALPGVLPVDTTRAVVAGFDLGAMAALLLQQRHPRVRALVSMDSGIIFAHNMAMLEAVPGFHTRRAITVPVFLATRDVAGNQAIGVEEDLRFLDGAPNVSLRRVSGMRHPDFTSYSLYATAPADLPFWGPPTIDPREGYAAIAKRLKAFLGTVLEGDGLDS